MTTAHSNLVIAGIDPGKTGALAISFPGGLHEFYDVPCVDLRDKDTPAWADWHTTWSNALEFAGVELIMVELVTGGQNGKKQGVQSMFNFGGTLRFAHAIALGVRPRPRVEFVTPAVWKAKLGLLNSGKGASRERCRTLYPGTAGSLARVKDDGRAEAALIAHFGRAFLA
jgi:crossover junction endodeoxyribonuclease RuvC